MRKLLLAVVCLATLAGCQSTKRMTQEREYAEIEHAMLVEKVQALPVSAKLECQLIGQQTSAAASNPRVLVDLMAGAYGGQAQDTCLRMKAAQVDEQRR